MNFGFCRMMNVLFFVRAENPIRDKKWFPWEHEQYLEARKCGIFNSKEQQEKQKKRWKESERLFVK